MIHLQHEIVVDRPVSEVFSYVTDVSNLPEWQGGVLEARQESEGAVGVGTRFAEVRKFLGRRIESTLEVTEHEPDRIFSLKVTSGPVPFEVRHTFEAADGGTRIRIEGEAEPGGFFKMAEPLVGRQATRTFEHDFATLKDVLEGRT